MVVFATFHLLMLFGNVPTLLFLYVTVLSLSLSQMVLCDSEAFVSFSDIDTFVFNGHRVLTLMTLVSFFSGLAC